MAILPKNQMSEEDIKLNYITPSIQPQWNGHITMETKITDGDGNDVLEYLHNNAKEFISKAILEKLHFAMKPEKVE